MTEQKQREAALDNVTENIASLRDMLGTLAGSRAAIVIERDTSPFFIKADRSQFDSAVVNMAVNARDAIDGSGTLTINMAEANEILATRGHPAVPGRFVAISMSNTGSGIPADQIDRIFEPLLTTKGTGLGLSQVFGFAKQSSGKIVVHSDCGRSLVVSS